MSVVNLNNIRTVAFGVCLSDAVAEEYLLVPVDGTVQDALKQMARSTADRIECFPNPNGLPMYEHSEKYASQEPLRYPIGEDDHDTVPVQLFNTANLDTHDQGLADPSAISFYFAMLTDDQDRRVLAIRRAVQFKGVLRAKGRLIRWLDDTMKVVDDDVFKLDEDFDYIVTDDEIYILRPTSFVYTAALMDRVLQMSEANIQSLATSIPHVNFERLGEYAKSRPRAARLVAAIKSRDDLHAITQGKLREMCQATGLAIQEQNGQLSPSPGQEMQFLYLLDRRRYSIELIPDAPETYEAPSRRRV